MTLSLLCSLPRRRTSGRGPALGGVCLGKTIDLSETRGFARLPTRRSVHVVKALRSWIELAMAHPTTSADSEKHVMVSLEAEKSAADGEVVRKSMIEVRARGLQVLDPKAAGALSCIQA